MADYRALSDADLLIQFEKTYQEWRAAHRMLLDPCCPGLERSSYRRKARSKGRRFIQLRREVQRRGLW